MAWLDILFCSVLLVYLFTNLLFISGNLKRGTVEPAKPVKLPVSIIVAIRNGDTALKQLIPFLAQQDYSGAMEFILVDDESTDDTMSVIKSAEAEDSRFMYASSTAGDPQLRHKKKGLDAGIRIAGGEILIFTDVDCRMGPRWVSGLVQYFHTGTDFVIGYSQVGYSSTLVSHFQSLDFHMLMAAARGVTHLGFPWASTGQNQAYRKDLFIRAGGFTSIAHCLQGDDSLFLQVLRRHLNPGIRFADDPQTFVTGRTEKSWKSLIRQRIRWAGDANIMWQYNPRFFISVAATFMTNLLILLMILLVPVFPRLAFMLVPGILIKFAAELLLYLTSLRPLHRSFQPVLFIFWFLFQIPYIVAMGAASFFARQQGWKGRK